MTDPCGCPGHAGHIDLAEPVYANHLVPCLTCILKKLCSVCFQHPALHPKCGILSDQACAAAPVQVKFKNQFIVVKRNKNAEADEWTARKTYNVFCQIPDETFQALHVTNPKNAIVRIIYVVPTMCRPYKRVPDVGWKADALTDLYSKIIMANKAYLAHYAEKPEHKSAFTIDLFAARQRELLGYLQQCVSILYHASYAKKNAKVPDAAKTRSLLTMISDGKGGQIRENMLGRRVNFTARSVAGGDPRLKIYQVGIPLSFAQTLSTPEYVTEYNYTAIRSLVLSGEGYNKVGLFAGGAGKLTALVGRSTATAACTIRKR